MTELISHVLKVIIVKVNEGPHLSLGIPVCNFKFAFYDTCKNKFFSQMYRKFRGKKVQLEPSLAVSNLQIVLNAKILFFSLSHSIRLVASPAKRSKNSPFKH